MLRYLVFHGSTNLFIPCPVLPLLFNRLNIFSWVSSREHLQWEFYLPCSLFSILSLVSKMNVSWNYMCWPLLKIGLGISSHEILFCTNHGSENKAPLWILMLPFEKDLLMLRVNMIHQSWAVDVDWRKLLIYRVTSLWEPEQKCQFKSYDPITEFTVLDCVPLEWTWWTRGWADCESGQTLAHP